jgi:aminoglycoside 6'-N-acetyltransferase
MNIILRFATLADIPIIKYWNKKPHVIFASGEDDLEEDFWIQEQLTNPSVFVEIFIAEIDARPIGIIQICDGYRAMDIWIGEENDLGKGYGTQMMKLAIEHCFKTKGVHSIIIDPLVKNTRAIKFYEKMGFKFVDNRYFGDDFCTVLELKKTSLI